MTEYLKKPIEDRVKLKSKTVTTTTIKSLCLRHPHVCHTEPLGIASGGICVKPRVSMTEQVVGILERVLECFSRV